MNRKATLSFEGQELVRLYMNKLLSAFRKSVSIVFHFNIYCCFSQLLLACSWSLEAIKWPVPIAVCYLFQ